MKNIYFLIITASCLMACTSGSKNSSEKEVSEKILNVYSHRHYDADKLVFEKFSQSTGIQINLVKAGADELISRMEMESENSPADVLITVDAIKINRAKSKGLLQPVTVQTNNKPLFIDPDNYWYGITFRARVIAYDKEKVQIEELSLSLIHILEVVLWLT